MMKRDVEHISAHTGSTLIFTLILLAVATLLTMQLLEVTINEGREVTLYRAHLQSYYKALKQLQQQEAKLMAKADNIKQARLLNKAVCLNVLTKKKSKPTLIDFYQIVTGEKQQKTHGLKFEGIVAVRSATRKPTNNKNQKACQTTGTIKLGVQAFRIIHH